MKLAFLVWLVLAVAGVGGWIANIVKVVHMGMPVDVGHATVLFVLRIVGIFIPPLGAILGYIG
jgi:hypothetical protein